MYEKVQHSGFGETRPVHCSGLFFSSVHFSFCWDRDRKGKLPYFVTVTSALTPGIYSVHTWCPIWAERCQENLGKMVIIRCQKPWKTPTIFSRDRQTIEIVNSNTETDPHSKRETCCRQTHRPSDRQTVRLADRQKVQSYTQMKCVAVEYYAKPIRSWNLRRGWFSDWPDFSFTYWQQRKQNEEVKGRFVYIHMNLRLWLLTNGLSLF